MRCEFTYNHLRKSSFKGNKDESFTVQCQKEKDHDGWCDYTDNKKTLGWKATETMSEEEKLDHYLAMLMSYCEDKYAYRVEIPEILSKIRGMIK